MTCDPWKSTAAEAPTPLKQRQLLELLKIERIYVDPLNGAGSEPLRDLLIGSLQRAGLFAMVENEEREGGDGRHEVFKSSQFFDGPHHSKQHGFEIA